MICRKNILMTGIWIQIYVPFFWLSVGWINIIKTDNDFSDKNMTTVHLLCCQIVTILASQNKVLEICRNTILTAGTCLTYT